MQKKLLVLAIAGFAAAPAYAQWTMMNVQSPTPGVNIFGILDQALETGNWGDGSVSRLTGSGYSTQRFGVRGNEDIGGGTRANFWLEASLGPDVGTGGANATTTSRGASSSAATAQTTFQQWDRAATIGLSNANMGAINLGRQYTPWFSAWARSDAFRVAGVGSSYALQAVQNTRMNNSLRYDSPSWGGFQLVLGYAIADQGAAYGYTESVGGSCDGTTAARTCPNGSTGLNINQKNSGRQGGFALLFDKGPWMGSFGYARINSVAAMGAAAPVVSTEWSVNGSYDFGVAKLLLNYSHFNNDTNPKTLDANNWSVQGRFPFGPHAIIAGYEALHNKVTSSADAKHLSLQYAYSMSKRTTLYATYARMSNDDKATFSLLSGSALTNNAAVGFDPSAFQFGVNHTF